MKYLNIRIDDVYYSDLPLQAEVCKTIQNVLSPTCGIILYQKTGETFTRRNSFKFFETFSGSELALHGLSHNNFQEKFEFQKWSPSLTSKYEMPLRDGKKVLSTNIFIPPHNYLDPKWSNELKKYGFTVVSSSKRDLPEIIIDDKKSYPIGVIKNDGMVYIPQTCFIKKKYYYSLDNYFLELMKLIDKYFEKVDIAVLTIHWWDFITDREIDKKFLDDFLVFIKSLLKICQSISLNDAQNLETRSCVTPNFIDWTTRK